MMSLRLPSMPFSMQSKCHCQSLVSLSMPREHWRSPQCTLAGVLATCGLPFASTWSNPVGSMLDEMPLTVLNRPAASAPPNVTLKVSIG